MALYAIGDIQGCFDALLALLDTLGFVAGSDRLWFTGDLVNRGPRSAEVLRFVRGLGEDAVTVLGNHDLHLLAVAAGATHLRENDTVQDVLAAEDRDELLHWLRQRPLLHHDAALGYTLVHAGLAPQWDLPQAIALAREVEAALRSADLEDFLRHMYGNQPDHWHPDLRDWDRLRLITNALTRMRYCDAEGRLDLACKGAPGSQPRGLVPWFQAPGRRSCGTRVVFGHWSTLGRWHGDGVIALDTGCLWGGALTAARLDGAAPVFHEVACPRRLAPGADPERWARPG